MRSDMLFFAAPISEDDPEGLVDGLACGDISPGVFVSRYVALGFTRQQAWAVVEDNRILRNIEQ